MCIFSNSVAYVGGTRIFARRVAPHRQVLVYQMEVTLDKPVAMILPLPVALPSTEESVHFVSLKKYEFLFDDLEKLFPRLGNGDFNANRGGGAGAARSAPAPPLKVREIGDFVASYVPTQADFRRLDPRFVLRPEVWKQLPRYEDYGFAVFQLKAPDAVRREAEDDGGTGGGGRVRGVGGGRVGPRPGPVNVQVHPMAFSFATRYADRLYFPTVHVHDGQVHKREEFDHTLYAQPDPGRRSRGAEQGGGWQAASLDPSSAVRVEDTKNMVSPRVAVVKRNISGVQTNDDQWLPG